MPLGRSTATTGAPLALIASIMSCGSPLTGRSRPAPNSASMISAGLPIACGLNGSTGYFHPFAAEAASPLRLSSSHEQDHRNLAAARREFRRRDKTVAAIVAGPGDDDDRPLLHQLHGGFGDGLARAQHQRETRGARGDGEPVGALHFSCGENFHAKSLVRAPYPEAFPMLARSPIPDDCMPIDPFAYFIGCGMVHPSARPRRMPVKRLITFQNQAS